MNNDQNNFKDQFDYAWNWFEYHAKQRISMFNFFLITNGFVLSALAGLYKEDKPKYSLTLVVSILGILLSICFFLLDLRNKCLVNFGEDILLHIEKGEMFNKAVMDTLNTDSKITEENKFGILKRAKEKNSCFIFSMTKHSFIIPTIVVIFILLYTFSFIYSIIHP